MLQALFLRSTKPLLQRVNLKKTDRARLVLLESFDDGGCQLATFTTTTI